jgi:FixJ family two-component response regulator
MRAYDTNLRRLSRKDLVRIGGPMTSFDPQACAVLVCPCNRDLAAPSSHSPFPHIEFTAMVVEEQLVFIVDDDQHMRETLCELLTPLGLRALAFGSAAEYGQFPRPDLPACLVLDVELPDINGLEFQEQIADGDHPPIVFITGHGDISSSVRAMKGGAVDFLVKPFREPELIGAINTAIDQDRVSRIARSELAKLRQRFSDLTPREREVLPLVASGLLNKQAAAELGISEVTLQIHRGRIMQKMEAASLADLVRITEKLGIPITHSRHARAVSQ